MQYRYKTKGTCSTEIHFDIEDGLVKNVVFAGGCEGNLKAITKLVEGLPPQEVVAKLHGITCDEKHTSCADQLSAALARALQGAL